MRSFAGIIISDVAHRHFPSYSAAHLPHRLTSQLIQRRALMSSSGSSETQGLIGMATNSLVPFLLRVGTVVVGLVAIVAGFLYVKQNNLLYFPEMAGQIPRHNADNPRKLRSPSEHGVTFETYMIPCSDGVQIHSWLLLQQQSKNAPTLVFFHGNAGNIGLRLPNALHCLLYTSPSPRDLSTSRMPSSA